MGQVDETIYGRMGRSINRCLWLGGWVVGWLGRLVDCLGCMMHMLVVCGVGNWFLPPQQNSSDQEENMRHGQLKSLMGHSGLHM